jgi:isoleucyl-tRNA synthetase
LEKLCNLPKDSITDLHRDSIDNLTFTLDGELYTRITDVFDCWFESGAMPYATVRTPHGDGIANNIAHGATIITTNTDVHLQMPNGTTHKIIPAEFIAEGIDQTRGWFYTLMVLSVSLYDIIPFKNVIVNGHVLANDGKKMSKRLKNYPDPMELLNEYGADAIRIYLLKSVTLNAESLKFSATDVQNVNTDVIIPLINTVAFLKEYSQLYSQQTNNVNDNDIDNRIDIDIQTVPRYTLPINSWIVNIYQQLRDTYFTHMNCYRLRDAILTMYELVEAINKCYIRVGRNVLKGKESVEHWFDSLCTLLWVIQQFVIDYRDILPFLCEHIHMNLLGNKTSVHLIKRVLTVHSVNSSACTLIDNTYNIIKFIYQYRSSKNIPFKRPIRVLLNVETVHYDRNAIIKECNIWSLQESSLPITTNTYTISKATLYKKYSKMVPSTTLKQIYDSLQSMSQKNIVDTLQIGSLNGVAIDVSLFDIPDNDIVTCINSNNESKQIKIKVDTTESYDVLAQQYYRTIASNIQKRRKALGLHSYNTVSINWSGTPDYPIDISAQSLIESIIGTSFIGTVSSNEFTVTIT